MYINVYLMFFQSISGPFWRRKKKKERECETIKVEIKDAELHLT